MSNVRYRTYPGMVGTLWNRRLALGVAVSVWEREVLQVLREHNMRQEQQKLFAGSRWQEQNLIFPNLVGRPADPSNLRVDYLRILEQAGLSKLRFHDLRHTAASLLLNHGVPVIVVSNMLGHAKPSTTLDVDGHLYHEMQTEAAQIMDRLVTSVRIEIPQRLKHEMDR